MSVSHRSHQKSISCTACTSNWSQAKGGSCPARKQPGHASEQPHWRPGKSREIHVTTSRSGTMNDHRTCAMSRAVARASMTTCSF
eukprot:3487859-Prymnesium_polylepis.1